MDELQPETAELVMKIGHRSRRAVVYKLNMFWAFETFEAYRHAIANADADARMKVAARLQHRSESGRYDRSDSDRYKPAYLRPANTVGHTVNTLVSAGREGVSLNGREGRIAGIDPLVLVPPDDPTEARRWLIAICTDKSRLSEALSRLAENDLPAEFIREIVA
ncbi:hypothetical protein M8R20_10595 [Pseudomonas sp. R2.Fl]|nr:hypothetical protein [Pseudomonas sp. R2.Fl]